MPEEEYEEYLRFLDSLEEEDEEKKKLERLGLTDDGLMDVADYDPE